MELICRLEPLVCTVSVVMRPEHKNTELSYRLEPVCDKLCNRLVAGRQLVLLKVSVLPAALLT